MEKKTTSLAILFADIAQSTKLYDKIGNNAAHTLISTCINVLIKVCNNHNGTLIKTIGDEIMCTFPTAQEAVSAAISMQTGIDNIPSEDLAGYYAPDIYIGIDYGPVIETSGDVFGDSVNVAARMVKLAKRRQIITTPQIVEALPEKSKTNCRCIDNVIVSGKSEELAVYEVVWEVEKMTLAINSMSGGKPLIRQRLELNFNGRNFEVSDSKPAASIGRLDHNDIVVNDSRVSRFHARIEFRKDKYFIIDNSTNGTYITEDGAVGVLLQRDEMLLGKSGIIDLCNESSTEHSSTAIRYACKFFKVSKCEALEETRK